MTIFRKRTRVFSFPKKIWQIGALWALIGFLIHYFALVLSLRYLNPTIPTLVLGLTSVCLMLIDHIRSKEQSFSHFLVPSLLIFSGLLLVNIPYLSLERSISMENYLHGIFWSIFALMTWILYLIGSTEFLKRTPRLDTSDWITVLGITTFGWTLLTIFLMLFFSNHSIDKYFNFTNELIFFVLGVLILGIVSSWMGSYMWNQGALRLPIGLAGQLSIFEVVFGLIFMHCIICKLPSFIEFAGVLAILGGILSNFRSKVSSQLIRE